MWTDTCERFEKYSFSSYQKKGKNDAATWMAGRKKFDKVVQDKNAVLIKMFEM